MTFNANLQTTLVEHCIITSPFGEALYLNSVPVVVEGIFSEQLPKEVRKTSGKVQIRQDLKNVHFLVETLFPQDQRPGLPVLGKKNLQVTLKFWN